MAIFINGKKKIKSIFVNVNGEKKSISSIWVNKDNTPIKVFPIGHKHIWEENIGTIGWNVSTGYAYSVKNNQYSLSSSYANNPWIRWEITVPDTVEFDITYSNWNSGKLLVKLDDEEILNQGYVSKTSTIMITPGTHTLYAIWEKVSGNSATITLNEVKYSNHICIDCKESELHDYKESIIKNPTCTEKGEKEFTCTKCNGTKIEEIDELGHNFVDGVCDRCGSLNLVSREIWSASSLTSTTTNSGSHYDMAYLSNTYSSNIEITEDMIDEEYLSIDFYVKYPFYGGSGHIAEVDGVNGLSSLQKYDEKTDTWETIYSYGLSYRTIGNYMSNQEGGYTINAGDGIRRMFKLEKGIYRVGGRFTAKRGCTSSVSHYYYSYHIKADLCKIEREAIKEVIDENL